MRNGIATSARDELIEALRDRYRRARKVEKTRILDEFVAVSGFHRKHAVRLLNANQQAVERGCRLGRRVYDEAVREAVIVLWETTDRICGKRLKAVIPFLIDSMERHGHLVLDDLVRARLLEVSAATIDRMLRPAWEQKNGRRKRRRTAHTKAGRQIPVRTSSDWNDPAPGYCECDFVAHGGGTMAGSFVHSLVVTEIVSGWTDCVPLEMRGLDTDNDSAFINDTVLGYCTTHGIEFTRSRPWHKNDQAWIEQKNGSVVRRLVGYRRFEGLIAAHRLGRLYDVALPHANFFQPSFKLLGKERIGSTVKKRYSKPATPCDRFLGNEHKPLCFSMASSTHVARGKTGHHGQEPLRTAPERVPRSVRPRPTPNASAPSPVLEARNRQRTALARREIGFGIRIGYRSVRAHITFKKIDARGSLRCPDRHPGLYQGYP